MTKQPAFSRVLLLMIFSTVIVLATREAQGQYSYYPITPCRPVDTRGPAGTNSGPALSTDTTRSFTIKGTCGVPATAKAVTINVTITNATAASFLTIWPAGQARPNASTINFGPGDQLANGAIVGLAATTPDLSVYNNSGNVHVLIDVTGYFQ